MQCDRVYQMRGTRSKYVYVKSSIARQFVSHCVAVSSISHGYRTCSERVFTFGAFLGILELWNIVVLLWKAKLLWCLGSFQDPCLMATLWARTYSWVYFKDFARWHVSFMLTKKCCAWPTGSFSAPSSKWSNAPGASITTVFPVFAAEWSASLYHIL